MEARLLRHSERVEKGVGFLCPHEALAAPDSDLIEAGADEVDAATEVLATARCRELAPGVLPVERDSPARRQFESRLAVSEERVAGGVEPFLSQPRGLARRFG